MESKVKIEPSWLAVLSEEFEKPYFQDLRSFLVKEKREQVIFPKGNEIFNAFNFTPFDKVKVVIIGQDPYHGDHQANGLAFSVKKGIRIPPSLKNIFKELNNDIGKEVPGHGDLSHWAEQGVLLLNATLTVRKKTPGSHQGKGWETFTDSCIKLLSEKKEGIVFLLWGSFAQNKSTLIDENKHYILKAAHPSPFSAHRGFLGCKHFSKTNKLLKQQNKDQISW